MASNKEILHGLSEEIERKAIERERRFEAIYERLSDAGIHMEKRIQREMLARKLESQGMDPEGLERLITHAHARYDKVDDWRGLLGSYLKGDWQAILKDLKRTDASMTRRRAEVMARVRGEGKREHQNSMPVSQRIFYALFFDQRPKEEIARLANMTPTQVLETFRSEAEKVGIPKAEIERRLRWAEQDEQECRPDIQLADATAMPVYGEDECI